MDELGLHYSVKESFMPCNCHEQMRFHLSCARTNIHAIYYKRGEVTHTPVQFGEQFDVGLHRAPRQQRRILEDVADPVGGKLHGAVRRLL